MMLFNEIDHFIEVYNNLVIEFVQFLGPLSFVGFITINAFSQAR